MKIHDQIKLNNRTYAKGSYISWFKIYPFFMAHMLIFGLSGFFMAYGPDVPPVSFLYMHGGIAILVYTGFYLAIFGRDEVKWMFINSGLGMLGIYSQIGWILDLFGREISDYPVHVHVVPFLYFILYTFLLRQALLDMTGAREDQRRQKRVEYGYVGISLTFYLVTYLL